MTIRSPEPCALRLAPQNAPQLQYVKEQPWRFSSERSAPVAVRPATAGTAGSGPWHGPPNTPNIYTSRKIARTIFSFSALFIPGRARWPSAKTLDVGGCLLPLPPPPANFIYTAFRICKIIACHSKATKDRSRSRSRPVNCPTMRFAGRNGTRSAFSVAWWIPRNAANTFWSSGKIYSAAIQIAKKSPPAQSFHSSRAIYRPGR